MSNTNINPPIPPSKQNEPVFGQRLTVDRPKVPKRPPPKSSRSPASKAAKTHASTSRRLTQQIQHQDAGASTSRQPTSTTTDRPTVASIAEDEAPCMGPERAPRPIDQKINFSKLRSPDTCEYLNNEESKWPVSFLLDFEPYKNHTAILELGDGTIDRFHKYPRRRANGLEVLRCLNCCYHYRLSKGKKTRPSVKTWAYVPVDAKDNKYRFVENPNVGHSAECAAHKLTAGQFGVEFFFNNALAEYQRNPYGRPFDAFDRMFQQLPFDIQLRFKTADEFDWVVNLPHWGTAKSAWYKARSDAYPDYDWDEPADCYAKSTMGRRIGGSLEGEKFIVQSNKARDYIFCCTASAARLLLLCTVMVVDATFKSVAGVNEIYQLFTIHALTPWKEFVTIAYALMPEKTSRMYQRVSRDLRDTMTAANGNVETDGALKIIMGDWEHAITKGFSKYFGKLKRQFCCFHFAQSLIRGVRKHGLLKLYRANDRVVKNYVHTLLGAMLVPPTYQEVFVNRIRRAPQHRRRKVQVKLDVGLVDMVSSGIKLSKFANYAYKTYFKTPAQLARLDLFTNGLGMPRTSNCCEGFHHMLYESLRAYGSKLELLMDTLVKIDYRAYVRKVKLAAGQPPKAKRATYVKLDSDLQKAKEKVSAILAQIAANGDEEVLSEAVARWARHAARLLGGAVHPNLVGQINHGVYDEDAEPNNSLIDDVILLGNRLAVLSVEDDLNSTDSDSDSDSDSDAEISTSSDDDD